MVSLTLLALASLLAAPPTVPFHPDDYRLVEVGTFQQPLLVTAPTGDARLFVVERCGRVRVVKGGATLATPYIDVSGLITCAGTEQGLLGMAFHPQFATNGRFFLSYTRSNGDLVVGEFSASPGSDTANSGLVRAIIVVPQPFRNHNGGHVMFGPDGFLYIGVGDGGSGGDPQRHGQNTNTLLGTILRIDVDGGVPYAIPPGNPFASGGGRPEIWLYGLRNPWRFWIDPSTSLMYVADVGQNRVEEVTILSGNPTARNLGWNVYEGPQCYPPGSSCRPPPGNVFPQVWYFHPEGRSITGGVVYRGSRLPELAGQYWYGDFVGGWINGLVYPGSVSRHWRWTPVLGSTPQLSSFGVDGRGEVYVVSLAGKVWRLEGRSSVQLAGNFDGQGGDDLLMKRGAGWLVSISQTGSGSPFRLWATFSTPSGWGSHLVGDFTGNGRDDLASYHPSNGSWWVSRSTGTGFSTSRWATFGTRTGWAAHLVGDFTGDGRDDVASYHPSNGSWWVSRSTGSGFSTARWGTYSTRTGWATHLVGDFCGNGRDDIASYHPSNGTWWVSCSTGSGFAAPGLWATFSTRTGWATHIVGDFTGDGRDDIVSYHPSNGSWWVSRSTGSGLSTSRWATFSTRTGWATHMVGDFNGDGRDDIVSYHPSNGSWWVSRSTGSGFSTSRWASFSTRTGWATHMVGDFNGDGRDDVASYHPSNGTWWVSRSTGTSFTPLRWTD